MANIFDNTPERVCFTDLFVIFYLSAHLYNVFVYGFARSFPGVAEGGYSGRSGSDMTETGD